jgi:hypothetical protein
MDTPLYDKTKLHTHPAKLRRPKYLDLFCVRALSVLFKLIQWTTCHVKQNEIIYNANIQKKKCKMYFHHFLKEHMMPYYFLITDDGTHVFHVVYYS